MGHGPRPPRGWQQRPEAVAGMAATALAAWSLVAHPDAPRSHYVAVLVLVGSGGWIAGWVTARAEVRMFALVIVVPVCAATALSLPQWGWGSPAVPPLGYSNANAALLTAGVAALLPLTSMPTARTWARVLVGVLVVASVVSGSRAGAASCVLLLALWPVVRRGSASASQAWSALVIVGGFALTVGLGWRHLRGFPSPSWAAPLSDVRIALWSDALELAATSPLVGVGPGNFATLSKTAASDADLAWAHSAPLQVLVELGATGLLLVIVVTACLLRALGWASAVFAILLLQPMIDYVLAFPAVVAAFGFVLGGLSIDRARGPSPRRREAQA